MKRRKTLLYRILSAVVALTFTSGLIMPVPAHAQMPLPAVLNLPAPGTMVTPTPAYTPALIKGLTLYPQNPLQFDFIVDTGDTNLDIEGEEFRKESLKMIKYFLASLTVPEEELWVNLSPYEQDRIIPDGLGVTEMGRDMLALDYLLKQLASSLMYPEDKLGEEFWSRVYKKAHEQFGTTQIPMNTFNKIWIVPDKAVVYEHEGTVYVVERHLKVMLEEDYAAMEHNAVGTPPRGRPNTNGQAQGPAHTDDNPSVTTDIIRQIIIPAIEHEVNEGRMFANLRQIYNSMILATWYKKHLGESLLGRLYMNKNKTRGIDVEDKDIKNRIYNQYIEAFKTGVYNYIKEDYDPVTQETIPRKYFSGGLGKGVITRAKIKEMTKKQFLSSPTAQRELNPRGKTVKVGIEGYLPGPGAPDPLVRTAADASVTASSPVEVDVEKRKELARQHLIKLGADLNPDVLMPEKSPKIQLLNDGEAEPYEDFEKRMVPKIQEIARLLKIKIAVHVMPSANFLGVTQRSFNGSAYIVVPVVLRENGVAESEEQAKKFLHDLDRIVGNTMGFGLKTSGEGVPSVPVVLFIKEGRSGYQRVGDELFIRDHVFLDFKHEKLFERKLLGLIQWEFEVLDNKGVSYLRQTMAEKYIDTLLEIAESQASGVASGDDAATAFSPVDVPGVDDIDKNIFAPYKGLAGRDILIQGGAGDVAVHLLAGMLNNPGTRVVFSETPSPGSKKTIEEIERVFAKEIEAKRLFYFFEDKDGDGYTQKIMDPVKRVPELKLKEKGFQPFLFMPSAVSRVITPENVTALSKAGVKVIAGPANIPLQVPESKTLEAIERAGMFYFTHYVVNQGGVEVVVGPLSRGNDISPEGVKGRAVESVENIFRRMKETGETFEQTAEALAGEFGADLPKAEVLGREDSERDIEALAKKNNGQITFEVLSRESQEDNRPNPKRLDGITLPNGTEVRVLKYRKDFPEGFMDSQPYLEDQYAVFQMIHPEKGFAVYIDVDTLVKLAPEENIPGLEQYKGKYASIGGTRRTPVSEEQGDFQEMLTEAVRDPASVKGSLLRGLSDATGLGHGMTEKVFTAKLIIGGSKITFVGPDLSDEALEIFGQNLVALRELLGITVFTAQDMGFDEETISALAGHAPGLILPDALGSHAREPSPSTANSVYNTVGTVLDHLIETGKIAPAFDASQIPSSPVAPVREKLKSKDLKTRIKTVKLLTNEGFLRNEQDIAAIIRLLRKEKNDSVRSAALNFLLAVPDPRKNFSATKLGEDLKEILKNLMLALDKEKFLKDKQGKFKHSKKERNAKWHLQHEVSILAGQWGWFVLEDPGKDKPMTRSSPVRRQGGINLNPELLDLQVKRDGSGVPLPIEMQPIGEMRVDGFIPVIIHVTPVNLPLFLGLDGNPSRDKDDDLPGNLSFINERATYGNEAAPEG